jgi:hypothetical protein
MRPQYVLMMLLPGTVSRASDRWEVTFLAGWTAPTIEERVPLDTEVDLPQIPGTTWQQQGEFAIVGRGSFAFGGSIAYFFGGHVGIEGRVDTVDFQVDTEGPRITGTTPLVAPLPPLHTTLDLSNGAVEVERLYPLSANVKLRTGGSVAFVASGGVSFLPRLRFTARQQAGLAVNGLHLAAVAVEADALSNVPAKDRLGFNGGGGVQVRISEKLAILGEARVFVFPTETLSWRPSTTPHSQLEEALLQSLLTNLEPIELDLAYFHVSGGLAVRF